MPKVARGERLGIALIGRRNVGKSSLMNAITEQEISIVSNQAGTTTDPIRKPFELLPIGPVTFYDTAGIDDIGELGKQRVGATKKILLRSDLAILVTDQNGLGAWEQSLIDDLKRLQINYMIVFNKCDQGVIAPKDENFCDTYQIPFVIASTKTGEGIKEVKQCLIEIVPSYFTQERVVVGDLIKGGDLVVLVVPIDLAAPKGRLILPQVQVIREILDHDAVAITVKERELQVVFEKCYKKPDLVIVDSQVVLRVAGDIPDGIPFTTFSTLFARYKGDIDALVRGSQAIDHLQHGDKILIAESCSHHVQSDDIGRVKIPRWIRQYCGKELQFDIYSGHDFPDHLDQYQLVIHCGGCMTTGLAYKRRIRACQAEGVPITNYGVAISKVHGVLKQVITPIYKEYTDAILYGESGYE